MNNKWIYSFLVFGMVLSAGFFALKLFEYRQVGEKIMPEESVNFLRPDSDEEYEFKHKVAEKDLLFYIKIFKNKEIFKVLGKEITGLVAQESQVSLDLEKELAKFELLGIISSAGKSKALIKEISSGKSFYCGGGERLEGMEVKEVLPDRVVFEKEGKLAELRL